jgi:hypothetical protein
MQINAMLCDAASVREGLLFILGGGITRVWRESFPARVGGAVALLVSVNPAEARERHRLRVSISGEDGAQVAEMSGEFEVGTADTKTPGEEILLPLAIDVNLQVPSAGTFSIDILIDGQLHRSLPFQVRPADERPTR